MEICSSPCFCNACVKAGATRLLSTIERAARKIMEIRPVGQKITLPHRYCGAGRTIGSLSRKPTGYLPGTSAGSGRSDGALGACASPASLWKG